MQDTIWQYFHPDTAEWFCSAFGEATAVEREAWPSIASGKDTLVSAPTGTGKTLSAFLVFLDAMKRKAELGQLAGQLELIYVSPLKSLAGDIRENLNRPLYGMFKDRRPEITVGLRTGDTSQAERRRMINRPPHILITTPESLYLLLTSKSGQGILHTARAVIIDELHALIDTKRGAHLMLSLARLDRLCGKPLQRIGLSATIEPLETAAQYLSAGGAAVVAPRIEKKVSLMVTSPLPDVRKGLHRDPVWQEVARKVYVHCQGSRSVLAFVEGRRFAEKLAYYVNQLGGEGFARTHHGSLSKEQRMETEEALRSGRLRLLCATSSMELGIDVGEIDLVLQIGCPQTISGTMQRLGRAGHGPGRVSTMYLFPRTAPEGLYCGMTAEMARRGGVEQAKPPRLCLDVLAQHLVSMAATESYTVQEVGELLKRAYPFRDVRQEDITGVLEMLAGDYEHKREIPARPRLLYDRLSGRVEGDAYSRMLAVSAGGTIPDKGMYTVKTEQGVKLGEVEEEFVYETHKGEKFLLGTFAWRILGHDKDNVIVTQDSVEGAKLPFWKGELKGRSMKTSMEFGAMMRNLQNAAGKGRLAEELAGLGLDENAVDQARAYLERQLAATGILPDDRTILVEHYRDSAGCAQMMVHSFLGRQVNAPLSLLAAQTASTITGMHICSVDEEDGFLLYPYGEQDLPWGILQEIDPAQAAAILEALLPSTPLFSMTFRYNAARALMTGVRGNGRVPLWLQRMRSTEMMNSLLTYKEHPLIRETRRECLEEQWDLPGVQYVLQGIRAGTFTVHEMNTEQPSPMSLPLQWQVEAASIYDYTPMTPGIYKNVEEELSQAMMIAPAKEALEHASVRDKLPEDEQGLHTLLMIEGDLIAGELDIPADWLEALAAQNRVFYREPGLWIAAEQESDYNAALEQEDFETRLSIVRRMLRYRGAHTVRQAAERYFWTIEEAQAVLTELCRRNSAAEQDSYYYHADLYSRARRETLKSLRQQVEPFKAERFAAVTAGTTQKNLPPPEQLKETLLTYRGRPFPPAAWEAVIFPARVKGYKESMLDSLLAEGEFFWRMTEQGLSFQIYDEIDWTAGPLPGDVLTDKESAVYAALQQRGASFPKAFSALAEGEAPQDILLGLAEKGLVCADSFTPVRQWLSRDKIKKSTVRQRVNARVASLQSGRFDIVRPLAEQSIEEKVEKAFESVLILCRETAAAAELSWGEALAVLRIWEYTGRARRGYFIEGLSGAQFIKEKDFTSVIHSLSHPFSGLLWLSAADPAQVWGKILPHREERAFQNTATAAVCLKAGLPAAVLEKQGKRLRIFNQDIWPEALTALVSCFQEKRLFPSLKRLIIKEYPPEAAPAFAENGFIHEMQDFVLYR